MTSVRLLERFSPVFLLPMCCCSLHFKVSPAYFHIVCDCFVFIFTGPLPGERRPPRLFQGSFWSISLALWVRQLCLCRRRCAGRCLGRRAASLRRESEWVSERVSERDLVLFSTIWEGLTHFATHYLPCKGDWNRGDKLGGKREEVEEWGGRWSAKKKKKKTVLLVFVPGIARPSSVCVALHTVI